MSRSYTVVAPPRKPLSGAGGASRRKCGNPRGLIWKVSTLRVFQGGFVHICSIFFSLFFYVYYYWVRIYWKQQHRPHSPAAEQLLWKQTSWSPVRRQKKRQFYGWHFCLTHFGTPAVFFCFTSAFESTSRMGAFQS